MSGPCNTLSANDFNHFLTRVRFAGTFGSHGLPRYVAVAEEIFPRFRLQFHLMILAPVPAGSGRVTLPPPELLLSAIVDSSDDAIISKSLDGIITSWNRSAERIFGYGRDEAIGRPIMMLLPADRQGEENDILQRIRRGERVEHFETLRRRKDGTLVEVSVTISPIRAPGGEIVGASKVARDISERKSSSRAGLLLAAIVASSEDAILSKNLDGIITSWNEGAQRIFGYTSAEIVGRSVLTLMPADRQAEEAGILARLRRGERVEHFETIRVRKNGEHFPVSLTISPVKDETGTVVGASKIARDITEPRRIAAEREQLLQSERVARAQAERANRMKDEFIATVSHELRTPLNVIMGWTEVLKDGGHGAEVVEGAVVIERNARAQAQLIEDLLDLGRISSGKLTLDENWLELGEVVRESVVSARHAADAKHLRVRTDLFAAPCDILGDKQRLQQVLGNLLSNAIKFTPKHGAIVISSRRIDRSVEVAVSDNGCGIDAAFLPHVFERFRQADSSTTRKFGGLGIGLALVKQLVELHGGTVRAESPGIGRGARFTVALPVLAAGPESGRPKPADEKESQIADNLSGIKVLVVDDDQDSLTLLQRALGGRLAVIQTATSMDEALTIFPTFQPDIVLSDIGMPVHDGYEFIRRLRRLPGGAGIPAAALTALARPEDRMRVLEAGYQTHLAKPIAPAEVVAVVRSLASLRLSPAS